MQEKKNSLISIDILRGLAASLVFFHHYEFAAALEKIPLANKLFITNVANFIATVGRLYAVPLFFLISGFCIHFSQINQTLTKNSTRLQFGSYIKRRLWRIYPPYLIILLFSCSIFAMSKERLDLSDFFVHFFVLQGLTEKYFNTINLVLWTITIEMLLYFLYPIWYYLRQKFGLNQALMLSILVSAISCAIIIIKLDYSALPLRYFVLNIWGAWCFGAWLCEKLLLTSTNLATNKLWWLLGTILLITNILLHPYSWSVIICYDLDIVLWAWFIVPLLLFEEKIKSSKSWLIAILIKIGIAIGVSSYSLYMLHEPLIWMRTIIIEHISSKSLKFPIEVSWFFLSFLIAWVSYQIFEKPYLKYRSRKD